MKQQFSFLFSLLLTLGMASFFGCNNEDDIDPTIECNDFSVEVTMDPDSTLTANVTGGTAPYTYLWGTGETTATVNLINDTIYNVIVTDENGCMQDVDFTLDGVFGCTLVITGITAEDTGIDSIYTLTANVSGGTVPYTYLWSNGQTTNPATTESFGTYTLTVTDAGGCASLGSVDVGNVSNPCDGFSAYIGSDSLTTTSLFAAAWGGTAPYTYLWSDGSTGNTINNPQAGTTYTVTITDANGCTSTDSYTVTINDPCASFTAYITTDPNATTNLLATSWDGTAPYTYLWSDGSTGNTINNPQEGVTYTVTITDANGCTSQDSYHVDDPCASFNAYINADSISITDLTATSWGGTAPYTYLWSDGATGNTINNPQIGASYAVTITDSNGCMDEANYYVNDPCAFFTTTIYSTDTLGVNIITLTAGTGGGSAPYSYLWSEGSSTLYIDLPGTTTGTYSVTATDANGCVAEDDIDL